MSELQNQSQLDELQKKAIEVALDGLGSEEPKKNEIRRVDWSLRSLAAISRLRQTERARDATQFAVLKAIAADRGEFKSFAKTMLPEYMPVKLLDKPKK